MIIPFLIGIYYSFFQWDGIAANPKVFVGFDNFIKLFGDTRFLASTWKTTLFTLLAVISVNVVGLTFALLVTSKLQNCKYGTYDGIYALFDWWINIRIYLAVYLFGCIYING